jgi:hypothetical protein
MVLLHSNSICYHSYNEFSPSFGKHDCRLLHFLTELQSFGCQNGGRTGWGYHLASSPYEHSSGAPAREKR